VSTTQGFAVAEDIRAHVGLYILLCDADYMDLATGVAGPHFVVVVSNGAGSDPVVIDPTRPASSIKQTRFSDVARCWHGECLVVHSPSGEVGSGVGIGPVAAIASLAGAVVGWIVTRRVG